MKHYLKASLIRAAGAALLTLGTLSTVYAAETITVVSWGGSYSESQRKAFYEPFAKDTNITVLEDEWNGDLGKVRAMVTTKNYLAHVIDVESGQLLAGCDEGLWEKIDYEKLGVSPENFLPEGANECGVGNISWSTLFAYDRDKFQGNGPKSWSDFWDVKKFPGKRGLFKSPKWNLEFALLADGVPASEIYKVLRTPEGVDRAFAKLGELKPHVIWWENGAQAPQLLADKEVVMTSGFNGRFYTAMHKDGLNIQTVWDGQGMDYDYWVIPKGNPQAEKALSFIKYASDPKRMANQTNFISLGPLRVDATQYVDEKVLKDLPTAPENTKNWFKSDAQFWADNQESLVERLNVWIAQ